jgi:CubicO group peptidase (beta-lactamase class C family)
MRDGAFSTARLDRLAAVVSGHVEASHVAGAVALVERRGEVHVSLHGHLGFGDDRRPVERGSIFRIASMTKPIVAVGALVLVEECRLRLDEPVDRLLPELADRRVLTRLDAPLDETVPAHRAITLRDLLTFRLGLGLVFAEICRDFRTAAYASVND